MPELSYLLDRLVTWLNGRGPLYLVVLVMAVAVVVFTSQIIRAL